jgi:hypothetical protein
LHTGSTFITPYLTSSSTYYAQAGSNCLSARVPVDANITTALANPTVTNDSICGAGTVSVTATSTDPLIWYETATDLTSIHSGSSYTTSISSDTSFFVAAENSTCTSNRVEVFALVNPIPNPPVIIDNSRCGSGSVSLSATASDAITWYDNSTGGNVIGTGSSLTTSVLSTTTTFYVETSNGLCISSRVPVTASINSLPVISLGPDTIFSTTSSYLLDAGSGFTAYSWAPGPLTQTNLVTASGQYCVTVTDANTCTNSDCIYVDFSVGINELQSNNILIYPQPSTGILNIKIPQPVNTIDFVLFDVTGKTVYKNQSSSNEMIIDLSDVSKGIYFVYLSNDLFSSTHKIILE